MSLSPDLEAAVQASERHLGVKLDYMRLVAAASPDAFARMGRITQMAPANPPDRKLLLWAGLGAEMQDDCGECVQIFVNLALKIGVPPADLRAALAGELDRIPPLYADAFRFGRLVAAGELEAETVRERLAAQLDAATMVDLAMEIGRARFYPAFKRALGVAVSCSQVAIDVPEAA
jgi:hypothetical protein